MRSTYRWASVALGALLVTAPALAAIPANAATSAGCADGGWTVSVPKTDGGTATVKPGQTLKVSTAKLAADARIVLDGRYVEFTFAPVTGDVFDYVYTGAANEMSMTPGVRTPVWASKTLTNAAGAKLSLRKEVEVRSDTDGTLQIIATGSSGKVKVQAKDCATGGIFQQEPEASTDVIATHTLAEGMFYYTNPYTGKINLGDGGASGSFVAKDSPQVATKLRQSTTQTTWDIAPGGRLGFVTGEDGVEIGAGASSCVQDCQAQNQINGELPVTDPRFNQ
jgi:hypothetical protein